LCLFKGCIIVNAIIAEPWTNDDGTICIDYSEAYAHEESIENIAHVKVLLDCWGVILLCVVELWVVNG